MAELSREALDALRKPNTEVTVVIDGHTFKGRETKFGELLVVSKPQAEIMMGQGAVRMGKLTEAELEKLRAENPQAATLADQILEKAKVKPPADSGE